MAVLFGGAALAVFWQGFAQQQLWTQFATIYVVLWYLQFGWKCFYMHSKGRWVDRQAEALMRKLKRESHGIPLGEVDLSNETEAKEAAAQLIKELKAQLPPDLRSRIRVLDNDGNVVVGDPDEAKQHDFMDPPPRPELKDDDEFPFKH